MSLDNANKIMYYVQCAIADGLQPDADGFYRIRRKDILEGLGMAPSTFNNNIDLFLREYIGGWNLEITFGLKGLIHEDLYTDISYHRGVLKFKRNPITLRSEFSYLWGISPKRNPYNYFRWPYIPVPESITLPIEL